MEMSYWETLAIGWRILWQGIGDFVLALCLADVFLLGWLPELIRGDPSSFISGSSLSIVHSDCSILVRFTALRRAWFIEETIWDLSPGRKTGRAKEFHLLDTEKEYRHDESYNSGYLHVCRDVGDRPCDESVAGC